MNPISLRSVSKKDWPVILDWLKRPHLATSWGPTESIYRELQSHPPSDLRIVSHHRVPIGLVCWQILTPAELSVAGLSDLPTGLTDIDIMIGEPEYLYQGYGTRALALLIEQLRQQGVTWIGVATQISNAPALKSFQKLRFQPLRDFEENGERYVYLTQGLKITTLKR